MLEAHQVTDIRRRYAERSWPSRWAAAVVLAPEYGVRVEAIHLLLSGRSWRPGDPTAHHKRAAKLTPGQEFGFLRVVRRLYLRGQKNSRYTVECFAPSRPDGSPCGAFKNVPRCSLVSGDTRSCGCFQGEFWKDSVRLAKLVPVPKVPRVRRTSRRCPVCIKSEALRPAAAMIQGEIVELGEFCRYCDRLVP